MRAALMYEAGDVRIEDVPDPRIQEPSDAVVRILRACVCGSDLWPYASLDHVDGGRGMGHEGLGVVEEVGKDVTTVKKGDTVVIPFVFSDGTCDFCREGLQTSCRHGGQWGGKGTSGLQAEAARIPHADGTLVKIPAGVDDALLPSLLTLSDVFSTGHHCAATAGVKAGRTVTVIGDGAVGLSAVLAAKRLGAERIILMGHHESRTDLGREFGATDVVPERGEEGERRVRDLTEGDGTHTVLECVGLEAALVTAFAVVRDGGVISRVGAPQYKTAPAGFGPFMANVTLTGGVAPARRYIPDLLPDVLEGRIEPGKVFDRTVGVDGIPDGYQAMADRDALKVMVMVMVKP